VDVTLIIRRAHIKFGFYSNHVFIIIVRTVTVIKVNVFR